MIQSKNDREIANLNLTHYQKWVTMYSYVAHLLKHDEFLTY